MTNSRAALALLFSLCLALTACGRDTTSGGGGGGGGGAAGGGGGGAQGGGDGGGAGGDQGAQGGGDAGGGQGDGGEQGDGAVEPGEKVNIIALQNEALGGRPAGDPNVTVEGIVTAGPNARGSFHVQEAAAGGPWTGLFIYNTGAPGDDRHVDVSAVAVGKTVRVTGQLVEFAREGDTAGAVTEIRLAAVEERGQAEAPAPVDVAPDAIAGGADAEQWEGVLVSVGEVEVTETGLEGGLFAVTGGLRVGRLYYEHLPEVGQQMTHLVGVLHYDFGEFRLAPRSAEDVGAQRADLPVVTPSDLQNPAGNPAEHEGATLALEGLVVTGGPSEDGQFLFAESATGGAYSGISLYNNRGAVDLTGVEVGVAIDIEGRYQEFRRNQEPHPGTLTQIVLSKLSVTGPAESQPEPEAVTVAELSQDAGAEPWEGVLVVLTDVTVATADPQSGRFTLDGGLEVDDLLHDLAPTPGQAWSSLTGVVHFVDGKFVLLPRSDADARQ